MGGYDFFNVQSDEVFVKYPKLKKAEVNGLAILTGEIDIIDHDGKYWESFNIEIHLSNEFPMRFPLLYETGGKIPRIGDWHVYEDKANCCVKVLPLEIIACKNGITLLTYLDNHAVPYLFNQTFRRVNGYYPSGEYSHGVAGIIEFYLEQLKTESIEQALRWMWMISDGLNPLRTSMCFCGKKLKYRNCHREALKNLRLLGNEQLKNDVAMIYSILKK